jgi:hypothetical protein
LKGLIFVLSLAFLASCNTVENSVGELNATELANIAARATAKCKTDSAANFNTIRSLSDDQYNPSESNKFYRGKTWTWDQKNGTVSITSETITVWKVATNIVYFIITGKDTGGSTYYRFLKVPSSINDEMIDDLLVKKCANDSLFTVSTSSSTAVVKKQITNLVSTNVYNREDNTWNYNFNYLAYFGIFSGTKTTKSIDVDGNVVSGTTTTTLTTTLTAVADADLTANPTYTSYSPSITQFCTLSVTAGTPPTFTYPYTRVCNTSPTDTTNTDWPNPGADL